MADRESYLYQAKLAEQAERYEGDHTLVAAIVYCWFHRLCGFVCCMLDDRLLY